MHACDNALTIRTELWWNYIHDWLRAVTWVRCVVGRTNYILRNLYLNDANWWHISFSTWMKPNGNALCIFSSTLICNSFHLFCTFDWKFTRLCGYLLHLHKHSAPSCGFIKRNNGWWRKHAEDRLAHQYANVRLGCRKCFAQRIIPQVNPNKTKNSTNLTSLFFHFLYRRLSIIMFGLILMCFVFFLLAFQCANKARRTCSVGRWWWELKLG